MHLSSITLRHGWTLMGWGLIIAVIIASLVQISSTMVAAIPDKIEHAFAYTTLMLWFAQVRPKQVWKRLALGFFTLGVILELLQGLTEYRCFSYGDIGANALGVLAGWGLSMAGLSTLLIRLEKRLAMATHQ